MANTSVFAFLVAAGVNYGATLVNTPVEYIRFLAERAGFDSNDSTITSLVMTGSSFGAALAQLTLSPISRVIKRFEHRFTVFVLINVIANAMMCASFNWVYSFVVRVVTGWSMGSYFSLVPLFVGQNTSATQRGKAMSFYSIVINSGLIMGYLLNLIAAVSGYSKCYFILFLFCALCGCALLIICWVHQTRYSVAVGETALLEEDSDLQTNSLAETQNTQGSINVRPPLKPKTMVRLVAIFIILGTVQMTTGINSMLSYASMILSDVFSNQYSGIYCSLIVGIANLLGVCVAFPIIQRVNRKVLMAIGFFGTVLTNVVLSVAFGVDMQGTAQQTLLMVTFIFFIIFYQLAPGPVVLMLCGEIVVERYQVGLCSLGFAFNWAWNIIVVFTYKYFEGIEYMIHASYAGLTLVLTIIVLALMPETRGKTRPQIEREIRGW